VLRPEHARPLADAPASTNAARSAEDRRRSSRQSKVGPSTSELKVEDLVDMTAMVDIVFFLLIFFLVTAMQVVVSSMDLGEMVKQAQTDQPSRVVAAASKEQRATVSIDADDVIWYEGDQIPSEQELRIRLRDALDEGMQHLLVLGHAEAHNVTLVKVLDAGHDAGFPKVQMSVTNSDN
jgi:biopolymer transport protein ExbD